MTKKLSDKELIDVFAILFEEIELTPEEVDAELREAGYDPDEVGKRMEAAAKRALELLSTKKGGQ